ncbi:DUF916 domain-containing protein [Micromonospora sp. WMMD1082]|uniref:WxL protein peptidoglycan domain-containing protein n=1 Tax=Micromonospora sp. WMMD1082 TaxID=3016104 RepID=UPI0024166958|nr:DUF916 domain-containing protein [Micromonospora sp. WMMD1082]MDG4795287.1 DUF916 domain-containing protein [Micromonospora sp. WMMD1082]
MIEKTRAGVRRLAAALAATVVATGVFAVPPPATATMAGAPDDPTWTVVPSSPTGPKGRKQFDYELAPTEEITDWFSVSNLGDRPITVDLYPTDAFTTADGGFALLPRSQEPSGVGSWIRLPKPSTTLAPGKRSDMPFRLAVPAGAAPGDHAGGIIAAVTEQQVGADGQQVTVERRIAARVYLRVAGPLEPAATVTAVGVDHDNPVVPLPGGKMEVTYRIANTGNVRLSGTVRVQVTGPLGVRLATGDMVDIPELLPDSELRLRQEFPHVVPAGPLTATVAANVRTSRDALPSLAGSGSTVSVPWALVGLLISLVGLLMYRWYLRRARRLAVLALDPVPRVLPTERVAR